MEGISISPSRSVVMIAALTSIESGLGLAVLYALVRAQLPFDNPLLKGLCLGVLVLAVTGRLFRQPFMNRRVGNPLGVVLVQDGIVWLQWLAACCVLALAYEALIV